MSFPRMIYRDGDMLPEHGVDYLIVSGEAELANALADGWREEMEASRHPVAAKAEPEAPRKRGRPKKAD